ncbi:MAG: hypothetical protein IJY69_03615 [Clostridia bacterium]|nr:hypothetical protein [Clostridia bacterium]
MKKSKLIKLLVSALSLCLLIGAMVGITAMAEDEGSETTPYVLSENVSYGDKLYLFYAVPTASFPEGATNPQLAVYDADGNFSYFVNYAETKTIHDVECYIFNSSGVAAKEINTVEKVIPCYTDAEGNVVYGEATTYSVEDYLYEKLYKEGYAVDGYVNDDDGLADERKTLYYSMLKYGATAQALLAPGAAVKIGSYGYFNAPHSFVTPTKNISGYDKVYLNHDYTKTPAGKVFIGWNVNVFDRLGEVVMSKDISNGAEIELNGNSLFAAPIYADGVVDFSGKAAVSNIAMYNTNSNATVSYENGDMVVTKTSTSGAGLRITAATTVNANANAAIVEMDIKFQDLSNSSIEFAFGDSSTNNTTGEMYLIMSKFGEVYALGNGNSSGYNTTKSGVVFPQGNSFNLRIEYFEADTQADVRYKVYVNDELIFSYNALRGTQYYGNSAIKPLDASNHNYFSIAFNSSVNGSVTIDNVSLTQTVLENSDDDIVNLPADANKVAENTGIIDFNNGIPSSYITTNDHNLATRELVYDRNGGKVLQVTKTEQGWASALKVNKSSSETVENANKAVIEFDVKATYLNHNELYFCKGSNHRYSELQLYTGADGFYAKKSATGEVLAVAEWQHVKIEYTAVQSETEKVITGAVYNAETNTFAFTEEYKVTATIVVTVTDADGDVVFTSTTSYGGRYNGTISAKDSEGNAVYCDKDGNATTDSKSAFIRYENMWLANEVDSISISNSANSRSDVMYNNFQIYHVAE